MRKRFEDIFMQSKKRVSELKFSTEAK